PFLFFYIKTDLVKLLISVACGRFPRAVREPPHRKLLWGLTWTRYSRWKDQDQREFGPVFATKLA
ncbi:MAG: hypothetical protein R3328_05740, partial [Planococcaceae bacterium]|nr:hypothetical protein [Planococcaceae bacterium]